MRRYPAFEIDAAPATLLALASQPTGLAVGGRSGATWLRGADGTPFPIYVSQRDLEFKFEVFSLAIPTLPELAERSALWTPPQVADDVPEFMRAPMMWRPEVPVPPIHFAPWPVEAGRAEVLRRTEYVIDQADAPGAFGENPSLQTAAPPGQAPAAACAACDVAVGLLFTGANGGQLLIAADWTPFNLLVTQDGDEIANFAETCERVELATYASRSRLEAFCVGVAPHGELWTVARAGAYPSFIRPDGGRSQPWWSSADAVRLALENLPALKCHQAVRQTWANFEEHWRETFGPFGLRMGLDWSAPEDLDVAFSTEDVVRLVRARREDPDRLS